MEKRANICQRGRGRTNSTSLVELWANNLQGEKEEKRKRLRQEDEDLLRETFKKSNKIVRTPPKLEEEKRKADENIEKGKMEIDKAEEYTSRLILEEIRDMRREMVEGRKELKEEITNLKTKITVIEEKWTVREKELTDRIRGIEEKLKETERKRKIEEEVNKVTRKEVLEVKGKIEEKEKQERKNNIIIRWMEKKEQNMREMIASFLEKEFRVTNGIEKIDILGRQGREIALVKLKDWETKTELMKEKKKLGTKRIYIDHDMTKGEREVQRIIKERADKARKEGMKVKIGYKKIEINDKRFLWSDDVMDLVEKNF